jgi:glutamate/tyrosine decarboxylase-like PLP-dependent enzyme
MGLLPRVALSLCVSFIGITIWDHIAHVCKKNLQDRSAEWRSYQYFTMTSWPGGMYASPSMAGSRPGSLIAGAWATMVFMGEQGYLESCKSIVGAAKAIIRGIREEIPELYILGDPKVTVVAFGSRTEGKGLDIHMIGDAMSKKGWHRERSCDLILLQQVVTIPYLIS